MSSNSSKPTLAPANLRSNNEYESNSIGKKPQAQGQSSQQLLEVSHRSSTFNNQNDINSKIFVDELSKDASEIIKQKYLATHYPHGVNEGKGEFFTHPSLNLPLFMLLQKSQTS